MTEQSRQAVLAVPVNERDHIRGPATASVTLVEYGDYECPYCGEAYAVVKQLQQEMGDHVQFVFRNFPLPEAHPHAEQAAEAAEAAADQGKFWEMHDYLFEHQSTLDEEHLGEYARILSLSDEEFERDLEMGAERGRVRDDAIGGLESGVEGTPTFFINGVRYDGSYDLSSLRAAIQEASVAGGRA
jgi:protein-disulfide isomerase